MRFDVSQLTSQLFPSVVQRPADRESPPRIPSQMPREFRKRGRPAVATRPVDEEVYSTDAARFRRLLESKRESFSSTEANVHVLGGHDFNLAWVRRHGIAKPIKVVNRDGLGMRLPA